MGFSRDQPELFLWNSVTFGATGKEKSVLFPWKYSFSCRPASSPIGDGEFCSKFSLFNMYIEVTASELWHIHKAPIESTRDGGCFCFKSAWIFTGKAGRIYALKCPKNAYKSEKNEGWERKNRPKPKNARFCLNTGVFGHFSLRKICRKIRVVKIVTFDNAISIFYKIYTISIKNKDLVSFLWHGFYKFFFLIVQC